MTANQLIKALEAIIKDYGNVPVVADYVDLRERAGNLADDCSMADVCRVDAVKFAAINTADDDGGIATNKDGSEKLRRVAIIH